MSTACELLSRALDTLQHVGLPVAESDYATDSLQSAGPPAQSKSTLVSYQTQVADSFIHTNGNEIIFLPTGFGCNAVVDSMARSSLARHPSKHIVICVLRPAQALSHAARLRSALEVPVGAYAGGDFLYNFEQEFILNRVLVFTAGLLMRLIKLGTYSLTSASLLVLHDAFSAIRNHPMNTLVREYYWKDPNATNGAQRPRIVGTLLPQVAQAQRPFDKLRQMVRKLCHSMQATAMVPTGKALEALAARIHRGHLTIHAYEPSYDEKQYLSSLQSHALLVWDTLHEVGQNHFGRLIHFPGPLTHQTHPAPASPSDTPSSSGPPSNLGGEGGSSANPYHDGKEPAGSSPDTSDPFHHDWDQIELMVRHSIACTESLTDGDPEHPRSRAAIDVMRHVLCCARAMKVGMEVGVLESLRTLLPGLRVLADLLSETKAGKEDANDLDGRLRRNVAEGVMESPLLDCIHEHSGLIEDITSGKRGMEGTSCSASTRFRALQDVIEEIRRQRPVPDEDAFNSSRGLASPSSELHIVVVASAANVGIVTASLGQAYPGAAVQSIGIEEMRENAAGKGTNTSEDDVLLSVTVVSADDVAVLGAVGQQYIRNTADEVIWFSAADVLAAAGFDPESQALATLFAVCGTGGSSGGNTLNRHEADADVSIHRLGPTCHVMATEAQAAAWLDLCRADQLLLSAMQLVQSGDATLEGYLCQLASGSDVIRSVDGGGVSTALMIPPAASLLHMLCLGLSGRPPRFHIEKEAGHSLESGETGDIIRAEAMLPEEMAVPGSPAGYSRSLSLGLEDVHFLGPAATSEAEARDAAAQVALAALASRGLIAAYWQTRALLTQAQQTAASVQVQLEGQMRALTLQRGHDVNPPASPFVDVARRGTTPPSAAGTAAPYSQRIGGRSPPTDHHNAGATAAVADSRLICSVCGIATTSAAHLKEHLAGRRHQKNVERLQQQAYAVPPANVGVFDISRNIDTDSAVPSNAQLSPNRSFGQEKENIISAVSLSGPTLSSWPTLDRLPSSLSDVFLRRSTSLHRAQSGMNTIHDGFPCVRVGEVVLPSSMDLRAFLDEMQQAGELEPLGLSGEPDGSVVSPPRTSIDELESGERVSGRSMVRERSGGRRSPPISPPSKSQGQRSPYRHGSASGSSSTSSRAMAQPWYVDGWSGNASTAVPMAGNSPYVVDPSIYGALTTLGGTGVYMPAPIMSFQPGIGMAMPQQEQQGPPQQFLYQGAQEGGMGGRLPPPRLQEYYYPAGSWIFPQPLPPPSGRGGR